jgi:hypothetical protein
MKPSEALSANRAAIRRVVNSHRASNARVFGSAMRGEDSEHSDLDILIDPTAETTLFDIGAIRRELRELLGVTADAKSASRRYPKCHTRRSAPGVKLHDR